MRLIFMGTPDLSVPVLEAMVAAGHEIDGLQGELVRVARLHADGAIVEVVDAVPAEDVLSINTPDQLAEVDAILRARQQTPATEASP